MGKTYDLLVIGAGFAGMAGALFAAGQGFSVAQVGSTGGIDFSTGFIDLMGVHPIEKGTTWDDPWAAMDALVKTSPDHPYAKLSRPEIETAIGEFTKFLGKQGLTYAGQAETNTRMVTPAGTVKRTYRVPATALAGVKALEDKAPTLFVDFHGLKGYSAAQIASTLADRWPGLRAARLTFPGPGGELFPEHMGWTLADEANRKTLGSALKEAAAGVDYIGLPAVLGVFDPLTVVEALEDMTGKRVFEVPTMPPSIGGPRLRAAFDRGLSGLGVDTHSQKMVLDTAKEGEVFVFRVGTPGGSVELRARRALLASGSFFGKGLLAHRDRVVETVFGLPVVQPESRTDWHRETFLDRRGHPVNMAGLETDEAFRPLGPDGGPADPNLYAAGAILAHQDWMRQKCGAGLAVATAYKAVSGME